MSKFIDLTGQRFGKLVVLGRSEDYISPKGKHVVSWACQCDCGNIKNVLRSSLLRRNTRSCGCLCREEGHKITRKNTKVNLKVSNQTNNEESMIVENMDNHVDNSVDNTVSFVDAYSKFENWVNSQEDKTLKTKSLMLWSALKLANDMNVIDEDTMKKTYGEFMFKQMEM